MIFVVDSPVDVPDCGEEGISERRPLSTSPKNLSDIGGTIGCPREAVAPLPPDMREGPEVGLPSDLRGPLMQLGP